MFTDPTTNAPSFTMTAAALTLGVVLVRTVIGGTTVAGHTFALIDDSTITALLTPTLLTYVARKATVATEAVALAKVEAGKP